MQCVTRKVMETTAVSWVFTQKQQMENAPFFLLCCAASRPMWAGHEKYVMQSPSGARIRTASGRVSG